MKPQRARRLCMVLNALLVPCLCTASEKAALSLKDSGISNHAPINVNKAIDWSSTDMELLLETRLNGAYKGFFLFKDRQGKLIAPIETLRGLDFKLAPQTGDEVALDSLSGLEIKYNAALQSLELIAPLDLVHLKTTQIGDESPGPVQQLPNKPAGMVINYELFASRVKNGDTNLNAFLDARAPIARGVAGNSWLGSSNFSSTANDRQCSQSTRLDTYWRRSWVEEKVTLQLGDNISRSLPWTPGVRFGGIQLRRNFTVKPGFSSTPLLNYMGSAKLPSTIEMYAEGQKQYSTTVPAGPFELRKLPQISGAGTATVVVTDALGQRKEVVLDLLNTESLLEEGLNDWSLDMGYLRRSYGQTSFDYESSPIFSAYWSRGMSKRFTLDLHGEGSSGVVMAGIGGRYNPTSTTSSNFYYAHSRNRGFGTGAKLGFNLGWQPKNFFINFGTDKYLGNYTDLGNISNPAGRGHSQRISAGFNYPKTGSLGIYVARQVRLGLPSARERGLSWGKTLSDRSSISVSYSQSRSPVRNTALGVSLTYTLDNDVNLSASNSDVNGRRSTSVRASKSAPSNGGWGWMAGASGTKSNDSAQAAATYRGQKFESNVGVNMDRNDYNMYAGAQGSIAFVDGEFYAARTSSSAFAVVNTKGVPEVPILVNNQRSGKTDAGGHLLVTNLQAFENNLIAVDAKNLPNHLRAYTTEGVVVPAEAIGMIVTLDVRQVQAALITVHDAKGKPLPIGSIVTLAGSKESAYIGEDGQTYLETIAIGNNDLDIRPVDAAPCRAHFAYEASQTSSLAQIGPLICRSNKN